jgi:hypothetical protein
MIASLPDRDWTLAGQPLCRPIAAGRLWGTVVAYVAAERRNGWKTEWPLSEAIGVNGRSFGRWGRVAKGRFWWLGDVPRTVFRSELLQRLPKKPNAFLRITFDPSVIFDANQGVQKQSVIIFGCTIKVRLFHHTSSPVRAVNRASCWGMA